MDILKYIVILLTTILPNLVASLANCPISCKCDDDTLVVTCGEGVLDVLPIALNPSLNRLVIKNNIIKTIDSSVQFYAELKYLDLSYNHLFSIPQRTFAYQKKLTELHLNHNKIGSIIGGTLIGLTALTILNLRGNYITELSDDIFSPLIKLEELNLGQNSIATIAPKAFEGLTSLRVLYLDDNHVSTIPSDSFAPLKGLAEIYLGLNSFIHIPSETFKDLVELQRLDLHRAGPINFTASSFQGLEGLRILDLSDNHLNRIPTKELSLLTRLEELSIGQNDFEAVQEGAFLGLSNLRRLEVNGSLKLRKIENGAFASNTNLESVKIASNKALTDIQEGAFSGLPNLKEVVLRDNALRSLNEGMFAWNELQVFDLSENPINCDCRVAWLRLVLLARQTPEPQPTVICTSPDRLRDQHLTSVSADSLGCTHADPHRQALIGGLCVLAAAALTAISLLLYRFRKRIREMLKNCGWGDSELGRKEREYQKTFSDEDFITRHPHSCTLNIHSTYNNYQPNNHHHQLKQIPVTEL